MYLRFRFLCFWTYYDCFMTIYTSWANLNFVVVDLDPDRVGGTDVLSVSAVVGGELVEGFFESLVSDELWTRISLGVECLKELCELDGLVFSGV